MARVRIYLSFSERAQLPIDEYKVALDTGDQELLKETFEKDYLDKLKLVIRFEWEGENDTKKSN